MKNGKRRAVRHPHTGVRLLLFLLLVLGVITIFGGSDDREKIFRPVRGAVLGTVGIPFSPLPPPRPSNEDFVENYLGPVIKGQVINGLHPFPEVNERYRALYQVVVLRYKKEPIFALRAEYSKSGASVMMSSGTSNDTPYVNFIVPKLIDQWYELSKSGREKWREEFENSLVVGFFHELEHLAYGRGTMMVDGKRSLERLVTMEKRIWAITCEHTILPFVRRGVPLQSTDSLYYADWVKAGRNVKSPSWDLAIRETYREIRDAQ
jgi:hypothetical protein